MISLDSRILEPSILVRPNIGSVPRNQSKSCSLASFLWGILVSPIFGQTHRSMQHFLNPAGPAEPAAPEDAADDFYEADTASLRSLVSPLFPLCVSLGGFSALRCSKFIPRWNYTTLNIGSIHFGGSYEDGIGDRALHHALGPRWRSVPSIWQNGILSHWLVHVLTDLPFFWVNLSLVSLFLFIYGLTRHISKMISIFLLSPFLPYITTNFQGSTPTAIFHMGLYEQIV